MGISVLKREWDGYFKVDIVRAGRKPREVVRATPAICLLLENISNNTVILINQAREAMISKKRPAGIMTEVVAGRLDKANLTPQQIASDEAWNEAGVKISPEKIQILNNLIPMASSPGMSDEEVFYAYGEVTDNDIDFTRGIFGDPMEDEQTTRVPFTLEEFEKHVCDTTHTFALKYWFLYTRKDKK